MIKRLFERDEFLVMIFSSQQYWEPAQILKRIAVEPLLSAFQF
jgi:hypothetical protein